MAKTGETLHAITHKTTRDLAMFCLFMIEVVLQQTNSVEQIILFDVQ